MSSVAPSTRGHRLVDDRTRARLRLARVARTAELLAEIERDDRRAPAAPSTMGDFLRRLGARLAHGDRGGTIEPPARAPRSEEGPRGEDQSIDAPAELPTPQVDAAIRELYAAVARRGGLATVRADAPTTREERAPATERDDGYLPAVEPELDEEPAPDTVRGPPPPPDAFEPPTRRGE